jgi:hypothetical protein
MPPRSLFRHPASSWRGFLLRVATIALAALLVLGVADWLGISLDPLHPAPPHPSSDTEPAAPPAEAP